LATDRGWPVGFRAHSGRIGLREATDFSVITSDRPCVSAAMFTKNRFAGASVRLNRRHAGAQRTRAVVTLARIANVATGDEGDRNAVEIVRRVGALLGVPAEEVLVGSTGVIGWQYPMPRIRDYLDGFAARSAGAEHATAFSARPVDVATAMMTTDTRPKVSVRSVGKASIVGVAKGVGMLEPDLATMLVYLTTDAEVPRGELNDALHAAVAETFNCLSVDTDTSTSDTVVVLANGAAGPVDGAGFPSALRDVCMDLTLQLARDGEGATKLLQVEVRGARDDAQAKRVAKSVLNSPLVKTAVHGADPNWGRVVMAIGKCSEDTDIEPGRVTVSFGDLEVYPSQPDEAGLARLSKLMTADDVTIGIGLGIAAGRSTVYGCDLSAGYVRINADYTT